MGFGVFLFILNELLNCGFLIDIESEMCFEGCWFLEGSFRIFLIRNFIVLFFKEKKNKMKCKLNVVYYIYVCNLYNLMILIFVEDVYK